VANWCRDIAENFNRLSRVHERYRQTDGRTTSDDIANVNVSSRSLKSTLLSVEKKLIFGNI